MGLEASSAGASVFDAALVYELAILKCFIDTLKPTITLVRGGNLDDIEYAKVLVDESVFMRKTVYNRAILKMKLRRFRFDGKAIWILSFDGSTCARLTAFSKVFLSDPDNRLLNWEHLFNQFFPGYNVSFHFEHLAQWLGIDTPEDYKPGLEKFAPRAKQA